MQPDRKSPPCLGTEDVVTHLHLPFPGQPRSSKRPGELRASDSPNSPNSATLYPGPSSKSGCGPSGDGLSMKSQSAIGGAFKLCDYDRQRCYWWLQGFPRIIYDQT